MDVFTKNASFFYVLPYGEDELVVSCDKEMVLDRDGDKEDGLGP